MTSKSKEIATIDATNYVALNPETAGDLAEILRENLGGSGGMSRGDITTVKVPAGGAVTWEIPTIEGVESSRELVGIIVGWERPRHYYEKGMDDPDAVEGAAPDCSSIDGETGTGVYGPGSDANPTGKCDVCPMNQWNTAKDGEGKACRETRELLFLVEDAVFPYIVVLPPTSIKFVRNYFVGLAGRQLHYSSVVTRITLEQQSKGGQKWATAKLELADRLTPDVTANARNLGEQFKKALYAMQTPVDIKAAGTK